MPRPKTPSWVNKPVYLPATGPKRAGTLPSAVAPPSRPVNRRAPEGTNAKGVDRKPFLGRWEGQDTSI
jgi:hypothetical protein